MDTETQFAERPARPVEWGVAAKALVGLAQDTSRTDHVFTIIWALSGQTFDRTFAEFAKTAYGQTLLKERTSLLAALRDRARLEAMPEGSLGRAYLAFMDRANITGDGLVAAQDADPNSTLAFARALPR